MRVRNEKFGHDSELHFITNHITVHDERKVLKVKYNTSFEKKIERLWFQSKTLGWSYKDFVAHLLEVLVVVRLRERANRAAASKRRIAE